MTLFKFKCLRRTASFLNEKKRSEATQTLDGCGKADPQTNKQTNEHTDRGDYNTLRSLARSIDMLKLISSILTVEEYVQCTWGRRRAVASRRLTYSSTARCRLGTPLLDGLGTPSPETCVFSLWYIVVVRAHLLHPRHQR